MDKIKIKADDYRFAKPSILNEKSALIDFMLKSIPIVTVKDRKFVELIAEMLHQFWLRTTRKIERTEKISEKTLQKWAERKVSYPFLSPEIKREYWKWSKAILSLIRNDLRQLEIKRRKSLLSDPHFRRALMKKLEELI